jgi:ParB family transcriptional regulator, chromosome partitioning protein
LARSVHLKNIGQEFKAAYDHLARKVAMAQRAATLQQISPDKIRANPDNPRIVFREDEMQQLMDSIKEVGIKVPVSLYEDGTKFVLLDGERRWRCAKRLNLRVVPAIVQPKPNRLENILMMFNIHNVRVDWDPMPMALKLRDVQELLIKEGKDSNAKVLSAITGVPLSSVRRALDLLDLPKKYQALLVREAGKPRSEQKVKADLFIEVYKSLHAIERHTPEVMQEVTKADYVDSMVQKYIRGIIDNVVSYREVSKIARAEYAGVSRNEAIPALIKLVRSKQYSIKDAYRDTVQAAYERRDLVTRIDGIAQRLSEFRGRARITPEIRQALELMRSEIDRLLGPS